VSHEVLPITTKIVAVTNDVTDFREKHVKFVFGTKFKVIRFDFSNEILGKSFVKRQQQKRSAIQCFHLRDKFRVFVVTETARGVENFMPLA
jgi:hypothetical protein